VLILADGEQSSACWLFTVRLRGFYKKSVDLAWQNPFNTTRIAQIAQSVEQRIENPRVGGSIPPLGTIFWCLVQLLRWFSLSRSIILPAQRFCPDSSVGRAAD
jgi:hypothetical protein